MQFASWSISKVALRDLDQIRDRTIEVWGVDQAYEYLHQVFGVMDRLAGDSSAGSTFAGADGNACEHIRPGLFRVNAGQHVVFYRRPISGGVFVVRILHKRMDFDRHL